jgi:hypothetical protein
MPEITVESFLGGQNRNDPERVNMDEMAVLENWTHTDGALVSFPGRIRYNQEPIIPNKAVWTFKRFYKHGHRVNDEAATTKHGFSIARCGEYIWVGCEESDITLAPTTGRINLATTGKAKLFPSMGTVKIYPADESEPYKIAFTAKDETSNYLTIDAGAAVVPIGSRVEIVDFRPILHTPGVEGRIGYATVNGRAYLAVGPASINSNGGLWRFDGFYYAVGRVRCAHGLNAYGNNTLWLGGVHPDDPGQPVCVRPGDSIIFIKRTGSVKEYIGPYLIESPAADGTLLLSEAGPDTNGEYWDYIIVRIHRAGIPAPTIPPELTPRTTASLLTIGQPRKYKAVYYRVADGVESTVATDGATITPDTDEMVYLDVYASYTNFASNYGGVRFYATKGGGSIYYHLVDIPFQPGTFSGWINGIYLDNIPDASLTVAYPKGPQTLGGIGPWNRGNAGPGGSNLIPWVYQYIYALYNSLTDTLSNPSPESAEIDIALGYHPRLTFNHSGWDPQADWCYIYRMKVGTDEGFKFVAQLPIDPTASASIYDDNTITDDNLGRVAGYDYASSPDDITWIREINGSLFGINDDYITYWSTFGDPEHWPRYLLGRDTTQIYADPTVGGYALCGDPGDKITSIIVDSGNFSDSGIVGGYALIRTRTRQFRIWGRDWVDRSMDEISGVGAIGKSAIAKYRGMIADLTPDGPAVKIPGNILFDTVHDRLFPQQKMPFEESVNFTDSQGNEITCGETWRGFYIFAYAEGSHIPNRMVLMQLPRGNTALTFTMIGCGEQQPHAYDICVWKGQGDNGELMYADAEDGYIWQLFQKTGQSTYWDPDTQEPVMTNFKTGLIFAHDSKRRYYYKGTSKIELCFNRPEADEYVTVMIHPEGLDEIRSSSDPIYLDPAAESGRVYVEFIPPTPVHARAYQLGVAGAFNKQVTFQGYSFGYQERSSRF